MHMEVKLGSRSVYQGTSSSRMTSLPKIWCDSVGIVKGDRVNFVMREDGVLEVRKDGV